MSIQNLVNERYDLYNVGKDKCPINKEGFGMTGWEAKPYDELVEQHNYKLNRWGIRLGQQTNGKHILSLDFDVCGKPNKDRNRLGCPDTQKLLDKYIANIDRKDGMFSSSTEGNMNVLVDYSVSSQIKEWVVSLGKAKFSRYELEILVAKNQVIPPTATNSKKTGTIGPSRAFLTDQPFYVMEADEGFMFEFLKKLFKRELEKNGKREKVMNSKTLSMDSTDTESIGSDNGKQFAKEDIYEILLFEYIGNGFDEKMEKKVSWDNWFQIAGILKYNKYPYSMWKRYNDLITIKSPTNSPRKIWDSIKNTPMCIHGLQNICKKVNEHGYKEWKIKYKKYLPIKILEKGENDVAKYIAPYLKDILVYCQEHWIIYDHKTHLWRHIKEPTSTIVSMIHTHIDEARESLLYVKIKSDDTEEKEKLAKKEKTYMNFYSAISKGGYSATLKKYLSELLHDAEFDQKLDDNKYQVAYKNGVLDLKTLTFRYGLLPDDFLTKTIPCDYEEPTEEDMKHVKRELKKICNNNDSHLDYYLSTFGYAMTGDSAKVQKFWCLRGQKACNGKSVIFEALMKNIPNYIIQMESEIFECNYGSRHKEVSSWGGARIAWINELSKRKQDNEIIKTVCDGTSIKYKVMYGGMATMPITLKLFIVSNHTLNFDADNGLKRRLVVNQLDSDFVDGLEEDDEINCKFKKDINFGETLQTKYKHALLGLIFKYSKMFVDDGYQLKPHPDEWKQETKDVVENNDQFQTWFSDNFELGNDFKISKRELETHVNAFTIDSPKKINITVRDELKRMNIVYKYDSQIRLEKERTKGVFFGFRWIDETVTEHL